MSRLRMKHVYVGLAASAVVLAGCAAGVKLARAKVEDNPGAMLFNGYTKPDVKCYHCHNGDGRGSGRGPDLSKKIPEMSDEAVIKAIDKGGMCMPAFADKLDQDQKRQILAWLREDFGGPPQPKEVQVEEVK